MTRHSLCALATASLILATATACAREIDSQPVDKEDASISADVGDHTASGEAGSGFRTHHYSERDAVLYSRLGPVGSATGVPVVSIEAELGDRVEELHRRGAASPAELEKARFEAQRRLALLRRAELTLERTRVRAPFAGVFSERSVRQGQNVTPEMLLFRITDPSPLHARIQVPEDDPRSLEPGSTVAVRGVNGRTARARIGIVAPTIDPASGTREVVVELAEVDGFRPGASIWVELPAVDAGARGADGEGG